jgi:hypothetical protein
VVVLPSYFKGERAAEVGPRHLAEQRLPVDLTVPGRQVIVPLSVIVGGVHHPEVT